MTNTTDEKISYSNSNVFFFFFFPFSSEEGDSNFLVWGQHPSLWPWKANERELPVVLFILAYKIVLTFEPVDKTLKCNHLNESYWKILSCAEINFAVLTQLCQNTGGTEMVYSTEINKFEQLNILLK